MITNLRHPYAIVKSGKGFKIVFLTSYDMVSNIYYGKCSKLHWIKICKTYLCETRLCETERQFKESQVIKRWPHLPSVKEFERAIKNQI